MTKLIAKLKTNPRAYKLQVHGQLALAYAERQVRGEALRNGDLATSEDGKVYEVIAAPEKLLHIECPEAKEAAIVGYLLGNGHIAVQIGKGFMRVALHPQIEQMMGQLGVSVSHVEAAFEPDLAPPPHDHGDHHHHDQHHDHGHDHGHGHDHDH
jgi:urease accessory protein